MVLIPENQSPPNSSETSFSPVTVGPGGRLLPPWPAWLCPRWEPSSPWSSGSPPEGLGPPPLPRSPQGPRQRGPRKLIPGHSHGDRPQLSAPQFPERGPQGPNPGTPQHIQVPLSPTRLPCGADVTDTAEHPLHGLPWPRLAPKSMHKPLGTRKRGKEETQAQTRSRLPWGPPRLPAGTRHPQPGVWVPPLSTPPAPRPRAPRSRPVGLATRPLRPPRPSRRLPRRGRRDRPGFNLSRPLQTSPRAFNHRAAA